MKKLLTIALLVGSCLLLFQPNRAQSNDLDNLQKQVSGLKNSNSRLEARLKQLSKTSANMQDSLQKSLNENDSKLQALSDTIKAKGSQLNVLKIEAESTKANVHSAKNANTIQYIGLILIIIILITIYYFLSKKIDKTKALQESNLIKVEEGLESDLNKTDKEIKTEITKVKQEFENKINDLTKKIAAINKQG